MFTGIVEKRGRVLRAGRRMSVDTGWPDLVLGESISVQGVCLTVARIDGPRAGFDVVAETLRKTTLGGLKGRVNLERALKAGDRLGGHVVQGHVDGTGEVLQAGATLRVRTPLAAQMVPKGSVAVDGVSLTVVDASQEEFSIALIPTTRRLTSLGSVKRGDRVNVELDVLLKKQDSGLTLDLLRKAGFVTN
ncbi:MAG TPA: riboflavin synthase [Planctomycetota bacterium]